MRLMNESKTVSESVYRALLAFDGQRWTTPHHGLPPKASKGFLERFSETAINRAFCR